MKFLLRQSGAADRGLNYDLIYLDFSKAFGKVSRQRLLTKVKAYGIDVKVYNFIKAWLSGRKEDSNKR